MKLKSLILILLNFSALPFFSQDKQKFIIEKPFAVGAGWNDASTPLRFRNTYYRPAFDNLNFRYRLNKYWTLRSGIEFLTYYKKNYLYSLNTFAGAERNFFLTKKSRASGNSRLYISSQISYYVTGHPLGQGYKAELLGMGMGYEFALGRGFSLRSEFMFNIGYFRRFVRTPWPEYAVKPKYEWLIHYSRGLSLELNYNFALRKKTN